MEWIEKLKRSFSLLIYLSLSRGNPAISGPKPDNRPPGDLVWLHLPNLALLAPSVHLIERLCALCPDLNILVTTVSKTRPERLSSDIFWSPITSEHPYAVEGFLTHWRPNLCLWSYGNLRPSLLHNAAKKNIPLYLIDVDDTSFPNRRWRWLNTLRQTTLRQFQAILAVTPNAGTIAVKNGAPKEIVASWGALQEGKVPLLCDEDEWIRLTNCFRGRPIWLAAGLATAEVRTIILAQKHAMRVSHKLLLVLVPERVEDIEMIQDIAVQMELKAALWRTGEVFNDNVQVLLAPSITELGIWYRLCPISFIGKTLVPDIGAGDPYEAAALGSAVLHGSHVAPYAASFVRLAGVQAAQERDSADEIAKAIMTLIASDLCATMAVAGWQILTEGSEVCDRLVDMVSDQLEQSGEP
jgi:3-deoxy-D-manno-octulosonic-acid transferase